MKNISRYLILLTLLVSSLGAPAYVQARSLPAEADTPKADSFEPPAPDYLSFLPAASETAYTAPTPAQLEETSRQVNSFDCAPVTEIPVAECQVLSALYASTNGAGWTNHANWLETNTISAWYGVTVSVGHVTKLILGSNLLSGPLPAGLNVLSSLQTLDLHNNQLSGAVPAELGSLSTLKELELYGNSLKGTIPASLGSLSQLTSLTLGLNQLSGSIPPELGNLTNLTRLWLYNNQLIGSIPPELGNLNKLTGLALGINPLTGSIPPELANLTQAWAISIEDCQLSGAIPSAFGGLTALMYLYLNHNQLSGSIPSTLGNLANLRYLELQHNQLSGSIPTTFGGLSQLSKLDLAYNQLSGSIPTQLGSLSHLTWLRLNHNDLTGSIPYQLGQGNFYQLDLGENHLSGSIPVALGNLSDTLGLLVLRNNTLSSAIPPELGNLTELVHLDLSGNQLSGNVPASFTNLVNLCEPGDPTFPCSAGYELNLGYNRLNVPATEPPASFLALKDPDWFQTQWQAAYIPNATGGSVLTYDGSTLISIPAGAAGKDFYLEYTPFPAPTQPTGFAYAGRSFDLSAFDVSDNPITSFVLPLVVRISYNEADLGGVLENTLALFYWNSSSASWEDAVGTCPGGAYTRSTAENWFSLPVCHLSEFALMGAGINWLYLPMLLR